ncbi:MAG: hypothetical protein QNI88_07795 [Desulfobacterales bacterium]|nr:hypothetical protein [Desulfobacterales bacterium]
MTAHQGPDRALRTCPRDPPRTQGDDCVWEKQDERGFVIKAAQRSNRLFNGIAYIARNFLSAQQAKRNGPGDSLPGRQMIVEFIDFIRGFLHEFKLHVRHLEEFIFTVAILFEVLLQPRQFAVQFALVGQIGEVFQLAVHDGTFHFQHFLVIDASHRRQLPSDVKTKAENDGRINLTKKMTGIWITIMQQQMACHFASRLASGLNAPPALPSAALRGNLDRAGTFQ